MEALRGGKNTLKNHIDYIIIEISFKKLYNNQPTYTELNKFLNEQNFELVTLLDFNLGKDKSYIEACTFKPSIHLAKWSLSVTGSLTKQ